MLGYLLTWPVAGTLGHELAAADKVAFVRTYVCRWRHSVVASVTLTLTIAKKSAKVRRNTAVGGHFTPSSSQKRPSV